MSIRIILKIMIKFILPIALFIAAVYGISYFWTNSSSKGKKTIALSLIITLIVGISLTIFLIFD
jgi:sensor domain CHASE-containing protein